MDDPGSWCWIITLAFVLLSVIFSTANFSLRQISWVKLEEFFQNKSQLERATWIKKHLTKFINITAFLRLLTHLGVIISLLYVFVARQPDESTSLHGPILAAVMVSLVLLTLFSEVIPHAWARYAGSQFLVRGYGFLRLFYPLIWPVAFLLQPFDPLVRRLAGISATRRNSAWCPSFFVTSEAN